MNGMSFYNFDVTSGSAIQAEALFDIFDDLSSISKRKRQVRVNIEDRKRKFVESPDHKKDFP